MHSFRRPSAQRGTSLLGLAIIAGIVCFFGYLGMKIFPVVNEFLTIRRAVTQIMKASPGSASEIRTAFDRQTNVEYSISTINGKDLEIVQIGDKLRTSFAYGKEIEIVDPVYLLLKFQGSATSGNSGP